MERPERPSRPEKPNRDHLRNSIRIRRRITSLLYGMGSQDSTDSDSEDVNNVSSGSRRSSSGRRHVTCPPYSVGGSGGGGGGGPSDSQPESLLRHHSSPPTVAISPPSRNFLDVLRSEPVSSSNVIYTLQPFRSPQRPLPVSVTHPLPMYHHHHHHHHPSGTSTANSSGSFDPLTNSGRNRDFNILMQSSASGSGTMRDSHATERDRPLMSGGFLVCDNAAPLNPSKRFCPNSNGGSNAMIFSSTPRHQNSFSSLLRDRGDPLPSTSSAAVSGAEDFSMSISRDTDRRLSHNDGLTAFGGAQTSSDRGNSSFVANLDSSRDDSLDGSDMDVILDREDGAAGAPSPHLSPPRGAPFFHAMGTMEGAGISGDWMVSPSRANSRGPNRVALGGRNQSSRSSLILRAVDELQEARMTNRRLMGYLDDEVLDEDLVPSSRPSFDVPASDSEIDEDLVRTAVTNLELLRDGGGGNSNDNDNVSQADLDRDLDRGEASSPDHGHQQQADDDQADDDQPAADILFDQGQQHSDEEEVVLVSVNRLAVGVGAGAAPAGEDNEDDNSDANSGTTEPAEELSNDEPFDVSNNSSQRNDASAAAQDGNANETGDNAANLLKAAGLDAEEGQDFNAKLLALLECPVCLETIVPPIHQCRKGHPVCSVCRPRLTVCPTCRTRFTESRNLLMEKVADMMQFPCKNYVVGCTVSTALKDKTTHELGCGYRQYSCIDRDCQWKGFKQELLVHCNKLHATQVIMSRGAAYYSLIIPFELLRQSSWVISALDEVFLVTFKVYPHNIVRGCTVFLGPPENASNYYYYFKFGNKRVNKSFKYREMTSPHKTSIHSHEFFQDTCFSYQFEPIFIKSLNGKCVIECKVAVTKPTRSAR